MKRDPRLRGLSSEHHHALVLARLIAERVGAGTVDAALAALVAERFARELEPHFAIEEVVLLPALRAIGAAALVARVEVDHARLREQAAAARSGAVAGLGAFAERLAEHVRFEEREVFPVCETELPGAVLDEVARRAPSRGA